MYKLPIFSFFVSAIFTVILYAIHLLYFALCKDVKYLFCGDLELRIKNTVLGQLDYKKNWKIINACGIS